MFCRECGTQLKDDAKFCRNCGWKCDFSDEEAVDGGIYSGVDNFTINSPMTPDYQEASNSYQDIQEETEPSGKKKKGLVAILIAVIILILAAGGVAAYFFFFADNNPFVKTEEADDTDEETPEEENGDGKLNTSANEEMAEEETEEEEKEPIVEEAAEEEPAPEEEAPAEEEPAQEEEVAEEVKNKDVYSEGLHEYQIVVEDCTADEAYLKCKEMGGHLVTFETDEEYNYLIDLLDSDNYYFIGGVLGDGWYHWIAPNDKYDGKVYLENSGNWMEGEPSFVDDTGRIEDCMAIFFYGKENRWVWNDVPRDILEAVPHFSGKLGYICEYE